MDDKLKYYKNLVHLSRLALSGRRQDIQLFIRRIAKQIREQHPDTAEELNHLLRESPTTSSPVRSTSMPSIPVDLDSRLNLVRFELVEHLEYQPIWSPQIENALSHIIEERKKEKELMKAGLTPTRSIIFTGPPGVGKTLAAKWLSNQLKLPLLTLDLSAVMSSFLGRTGANIRHVLDYAKSVDCLLFLDEIDAVAKKRADSTEIGELKRLVTVILQEIDDWPASGILIAATNHPDLLDPAVWRRFDMNIKFNMPNKDQIKEAISIFLGQKEINKEWMDLLAMLFKDLSFNDIERSIFNIRRESIIKNQPIEEALVRFVSNISEDMPLQKRSKVAAFLTKSGLSQRRVSDITGVSRDTIRKNLTDNKESK